MKKFSPGLSILIAYLLITSFMPSMKPMPKRSWLNIQFTNYIGNEILKLDTTAYTNEFAQRYSVTKCKYYISDIRLKDTSGYEYYITSSYLLNQEDESSMQIILKEVPYGSFLSMSFIIGVDSVHSSSGAQTGTLDPVNGMFWTWNTGYVFMKLEGKAPASKSPKHLFEFHIGGYQEPNNNIRRVSISFKPGVKLVAFKDTYLNLKADVSEILKTPNAIDFSKISSVTDFHNASMIADNYQDMFSFLSFRQE